MAENTARGLARPPIDPVEEAFRRGRRSDLRTLGMPPTISDPHATAGSDGRPGGLGREIGSQGYISSLRGCIGAVLLIPRLHSGCAREIIIIIDFRIGSRRCNPGGQVIFFYKIGEWGAGTEVFERGKDRYGNICK